MMQLCSELVYTEKVSFVPYVAVRKLRITKFDVE